jgi:hypothetical protein
VKAVLYWQPMAQCTNLHLLAIICQ